MSSESNFFDLNKTQTASQDHEIKIRLLGSSHRQPLISHCLMSSLVFDIRYNYCPTYCLTALSKDHKEAVWVMSRSQSLIRGNTREVCRVCSDEGKKWVDSQWGWRLGIATKPLCVCVLRFHETYSDSYRAETDPPWTCSYMSACSICKTLYCNYTQKLLDTDLRRVNAYQGDRDDFKGIQGCFREICAADSE